MSIIDGHLHLNLKEIHPLKNLLCQMDHNDIEKSMLILNTEDEFNAFERERKTYYENDNRIWIACGLNIHDSSSKERVDVLLSRGIDVKLKIHPNMFSIIREDFHSVIEAVSPYNRTIIVDTLFYGAKLECHVGYELGLLLACTFPERKIIMAHSGSIDFLKCMMSTRYLHNVFYDYSFIQSFFSKTSLRFDMVDFLSRTSNRIIFGSDYPSFSIQEAISDFRSLLAETSLNKTQVQDVFYTNAMKIYS